MRSVLDALYASRAPQHLHNDPLSFCHRYPDPRDCEIVAVIASSFAYGSVGVILRTIETICAELGRSPRRYVDRLDPLAAVRTFSRFKHRFNDGRDLAALLWGIRQMIKHSGSIQAFFLQGYGSADKDIESALNCYSAAVLSLDYSALFQRHDIPPDSRFPFLFPAPRSGSACKRLCMLLRWLVRPADGTDLGLWDSISPAQLIIPVDTHISRICRYLGLTGRRIADWRMAQEITAALRILDPEDPVKYDFTLAHLGISSGCDGNDRGRCTDCPIASICAQSCELRLTAAGVMI